MVNMPDCENMLSALNEHQSNLWLLKKEIQVFSEILTVLNEKNKQTKRLFKQKIHISFLGSHTNTSYRTGAAVAIVT